MFIYGFSFTSHVPLLLRVQYTYFLLLKLFGERWPLLHSTTQFHPHSVRKNVRLLIVSLRHSMPSVQLAQPLYGGFPSPVPAQSAQKLLREKEGLPPLSDPQSQVGKLCRSNTHIFVREQTDGSSGDSGVTKSAPFLIRFSS